nr:unnamed protein product [Callosobruchus chinensis]
MCNKGDSCQSEYSAPVRTPKKERMKHDYTPQLLNQVLDTIASMKDANGSPPQKIMQRLVTAHNVPAKKVQLVVKKALRSGIKSGLIKEVPGGKYKLGMDKRDYKVLKKFQKLEEEIGSELPVRQVRRRRKRSKRSKRRKRTGRSRRRRSRSRRRRRHSEDIDENTEKKKSSSDTRRKSKKADADPEEGTSGQKSSKSIEEEPGRKYADDSGDEKERVHESDLSYGSDHCLYGNPALDHHNDSCSHHRYDPNTYC